MSQTRLSGEQLSAIDLIAWVSVLTSICTFDRTDKSLIGRSYAKV
ncbi:hypothetical protein [Chamaesiphon sp.]